MCLQIFKSLNCIVIVSVSCCPVGCLDELATFGTTRTINHTLNLNASSVDSNRLYFRVPAVKAILHLQSINSHFCGLMHKA